MNRFYMTLTTSQSNSDFIWHFLVAMLSALIVTTILSIFQRNKPKVDQGFVLNYFRLSYRRKLIRTLWTMAIGLVLLIAALFLISVSWVIKASVFIIFVVFTVLQIWYNYIMWKREND